MGQRPPREQWHSTMGFVLATVGSAVGLGNVWRFPTMVARRGGGAFLLVYLVAVVAVGIPLMMAELALGRSSSANVVDAFESRSSGTGWGLIGGLAALAALTILSYYAVIAGWTLIYAYLGMTGHLAGLSSDALNQLFSHLTQNTLWPLAAQALFLLLSATIVAAGVTAGIERYSTILLPSMVTLLLVLLGRALLLPGAVEGVRWFLRMDLQAINFSVALEAVGQVFFSFSLGMGAVITYGSYLTPDDNIPQNSLLITATDVLIALLAGLVVVSALFAFGIDLDVGAGLIFVALPSVFNTLPAATLWATLFFLSLTFAALTSLISFMEVLNAVVMEKLNWSRHAAVIAVAAAVFVAGVPSSLAEGPLAHIAPAGMNLLDFFDFVASNAMLPFSGLLTVIFVGWVWGAERAEGEITRGAGQFSLAVSRLWEIIIKYVGPVALAYILINGIIGG